MKFENLEKISKWTGLFQQMSWAFWKKGRPLGSSPYETPNFTFRRASFRSRGGRWPPAPAPETFAFFPGDPHVKKFGTIWARGREKILQEKNQVSYRSIQI